MLMKAANALKTKISDRVKKSLQNLKLSIFLKTNIVYVWLKWINPDSIVTSDVCTMIMHYLKYN